MDSDLGSLGSLGSLLVQFADTRDLGRRMTALAATASSLKSVFPPQTGPLKQHERMLQDSEEVRKSLAAIGVGESVQKFLAALANATATLDRVDDAVLRWIRDRHAEKRFSRFETYWIVAQYIRKMSLPEVTRRMPSTVSINAPWAEWIGHVVQDCRKIVEQFDI